MNKDLIAAGFLLVGAGLYVGWLFTVKRGQSALSDKVTSRPVGGSMKLPQVVGPPSKQATVPERFNAFKNDVRHLFSIHGWAPPGGEIPDLPTR